MAKVLVDTNFILSAVRNKFDFYEALTDAGHSILIPEEVLKEVRAISEFRASKKTLDEALLALKIVNAIIYQKISCPGNDADDGIRKYLAAHPETLLATMDKALKKSVRNRKVVIRNRKKIEVQ